jgi:hypothetical protein
MKKAMITTIVAAGRSMMKTIMMKISRSRHTVVDSMKKMRMITTNRTTMKMRTTMMKMIMIAAHNPVTVGMRKIRTIIMTNAVAGLETVVHHRVRAADHHIMATAARLGIAAADRHKVAMAGRMVAVGDLLQWTVMK